MGNKWCERKLLRLHKQKIIAISYLIKQAINGLVYWVFGFSL